MTPRAVLAAPTLFRSWVIRCGRCKAWWYRLPQFMGDGSGDKGDYCEKCGCTSVTITEGRPFGPRSKRWPMYLKEWRGYMQSIPEFMEEMRDTWSMVR